MCVTKNNISPAFAVQLLDRLCQVIKDYVGVLNEEAIRKNFILILELLGEVVVRLRSDATLAYHCLVPPGLWLCSGYLVGAA